MQTPSQPPARFSGWMLGLCIAGMFVVAIILASIGAPQFPVTLAIAGISVVLATRWLKWRRHHGVAVQDIDLESFPVRLPATRVAVGRTVQFTFLPKKRAVTAPGMLCAAPGHIRFVPSKASHAERAWEAAVRTIEVTSMRGQASTVRVTAGDGEQAQFVAMVDSATAQSSLSPYVSVTS